MNTLTGAIDSMVSISRFNKGEASKIFDEVRRDGDKIVLKNNVPTCVLIEPERYKAIMESLEDFALLQEAEDRLSKGNDYVTHKDILEKFNINEDALADTDVEIE